MRKILSVRLLLVLEETRQKLEAEIADLQAQLDEVNSFLRVNEPEPPAKNVPQRTFPKSASSKNGHAKIQVPRTAKPTPSEKEKFNSDLYTEAIKRLPENFNTEMVRQSTDLAIAQVRNLIITLTRRGWILRTSWGHWRKSPIFGSRSDIAHLQPEALPPVPTLDSTKLDQLNTKLNDLQKQHDNAVDGSMQQTVLADQIEDLEAQIGKLEELENKA